jgi:hypothetical protein
MGCADILASIRNRGTRWMKMAGLTPCPFYHSGKNDGLRGQETG